MCGLWEYFSCMRECGKSSEDLYTMVCQSQCNALYSVGHSQGSVTKKMCELGKNTFMQLSCCYKKECLVDNIQRELLEVRTTKEKYFNYLSKKCNLAVRVRQKTDSMQVYSALSHNNHQPLNNSLSH